MGRPRVYSDEFRERAVRLVKEWREARGVTDGGVTAVGRQFGLGRETIRPGCWSPKWSPEIVPGSREASATRSHSSSVRTKSSVGRTRS